MARRPEIEQNIRSKIDQILKKSGESFAAGDSAGSLSLAIEAWDLIPEPKQNWDYYPQSLSRAFIQDYVDLGDRDGVKKWVAIMAEMYDDPDHENHYVLMAEGEAMYRLGDLDRAYYVFGRIHELFGNKGFVGEQLDYLEFYRKRKAQE